MSPPAPQSVELNLLFVHGIHGCDSAKLGAHDSLKDLDDAVQASLPTFVAAWEGSHPGFVVKVRTARANIYTATPSPYVPSGEDPLHLDDWTVGTAAFTSVQGDPGTTAFEWRYRVAQEIHRLFPEDAKNIVLVGHSTGGRTVFEVAANAGSDGVGFHDWGVQGRIAAAISIHGMIDEVGSNRYNVIGPFDFESSCKFSGVADSIGLCGAGSGWCEYAGRVSGRAAADWVAQMKHGLALTSWASCSPSLWTGYTDGSLPYDAQASVMMPGLDMTPGPGQTWRPSHGVRYGGFCHSDITNVSHSSHGDAVAAATSQILDFLFVRAPRVVSQGALTTPEEWFGQGTPFYSVGAAACPVGEQSAGLEVVGACRHPGYFDGDDHPVSSSEVVQSSDSTCGGTFQWTQAHDTDNPHDADFAWKTLSQRPGGVLDALTAK